MGAHRRVHRRRAEAGRGGGVMGKETDIQWTATVKPDGTIVPGATFNPWWGCLKVSQACAACYAETFDKRTGGDHWGANARRRFFGDKHWNEPLKWNREAEKEGVRRRVFCASMADVFEALLGTHPDCAQMERERTRLWLLIDKTPHLDWLLLTKRPENVMGMVPAFWRNGFPSNVWMGTTVEDQENADRRIPHLLRIPASVRFLSMEPLLGPVDLWCIKDGSWWDREGANCYNALTGTAYWSNGDHGLGGGPKISWVILGGESGPKARATDPIWIRDLLAQCIDNDVAPFVKQLGERWARRHHQGLRKFDAHGGTPEEGWPTDLIVRQFPR